MYQGLFNSSYVPTQLELVCINDPANTLEPWFCSAVFSLLLNVSLYLYASQRLTRLPLRVSFSLKLAASLPPSHPICFLISFVSPQTYNYAEQQNKDPPHLRFLVYFSFLLCIAKSADTLSIMVGFLIGVFSAPYLCASLKQFGDYSSLVYGWTLDQDVTIAWGSFMGLLVQSHFIYRTFMLSRNWYFLAIASLAALGGFAASIVFVFNFRLYGPDGRWADLFNMLMPYLYVISLLFTNSRQ
ncbi:hypothetical protein FRC10_011237 [Ceratobasidium sp. 414]|nr:hypothetical protein FRC10_011237 [Ceratobasidium sp. 414]